MLARQVLPRHGYESTPVTECHAMCHCIHDMRRNSMRRDNIRDNQRTATVHTGCGQIHCTGSILSYQQHEGSMLLDDDRTIGEQCHSYGLGSNRSDSTKRLRSQPAHQPHEQPQYIMKTNRRFLYLPIYIIRILLPERIHKQIVGKRRVYAEPLAMSEP